MIDKICPKATIEFHCASCESVRINGTWYQDMILKLAYEIFLDWMDSLDTEEWVRVNEYMGWLPKEV